ncbi:hypothetical protein TRVA0_097S00188 [Trichomonascus vanleenenianus]|uniref:Ccm1p n=1 Tax=Trichomonascus vanleenenianus TaxID=2268995 RepID=UPI003ECB7C56
MIRRWRGVPFRSIYMASRRRKPVDNVQEKRALAKDIQEEKELREGLKQLQAYNAALKRHIWEQDDEKMRKEIAEREGLKLDRSPSEKEVDDLTEFLSLPEEDKLGAKLFESAPKLPQKLMERVGGQALVLMNQERWAPVVRALYNNPMQLKDLTTGTVDSLLKAIPVSERANYAGIIKEMMDDAGIKESKFTMDLIMAGYADRGAVDVVRAFMKHMVEQGYRPDDFTYGHLLKALGKQKDLVNSAKVLREMQANGIEPSMRVCTTLLQTCIKVGDYKQAQDIFAMMKFLSTESQPDVRVYNSLMLAAAKEYNVDRVLDLFREMTTRPIDPLSPDVETYQTLIYACSRDLKTHVLAWKYVLELQQRKYPITRKLVNTIMYLCGSTGELSFARAMFRQLCGDPTSYPDALTLNSLFKAYANYKPGFISPVLLTSDLGNQIRSSFLFVTDAKSTNEYLTPPLLDTPLLRTPFLVIAESQAMFEFFKEHHPDCINDKNILTYLSIPARCRNFDEFARRYNSCTYIEDPDSVEIVGEQHPGKVCRNHHTYDLAISFCAENPSPKTLEFAQKVWTDRGKWRKTRAFRELPQEQRKKSDFLFARGMIDVLAANELPSEACDILGSTIKLFPWRRHHLVNLINTVQKHEDFALLGKIEKLITNKKKREKGIWKEYARVQGDADYSHLTKR